MLRRDEDTRRTLGLAEEDDRGDMHRRDEDSRGMTGVAEVDDSPHARPSAVLQYTFTITLISGRK